MKRISMFLDWLGRGSASGEVERRVIAAEHAESQALVLGTFRCDPLLLFDTGRLPTSAAAKWGVFTKGVPLPRTFRSSR